MALGNMHVDKSNLPAGVALWLHHFAMDGYYNADDPLMNDYANIAESNLDPCSHGDPAAIAYVMACLMTRQILYFKDHPGDCGSQGSVSLGAAGVAAKGAEFASLGASTAVGIASLGSASIIGTAIPAAALSAIPFIGLATLPIAVWGIISAHHAQAVATEQEVNCQVAQYVNTFLANVDAAMRVGQGSISDALNSMKTALAQALSGLRTGIDLGGCNWSRAGAAPAVKALFELKSELYQQGTISTPASQAANSGITKLALGGGALALGFQFT